MEVVAPGKRKKERKKEKEKKRKRKKEINCSQQNCRPRKLKIFPPKYSKTWILCF